MQYLHKTPKTYIFCYSTLPVVWKRCRDGQGFVYYLHFYIISNLFAYFLACHPYFFYCFLFFSIIIVWPCDPPNPSIIPRMLSERAEFTREIERYCVPRGISVPKNVNPRQVTSVVVWPHMHVLLMLTFTHLLHQFVPERERNTH